VDGGGAWAVLWVGLDLGVSACVRHLFGLSTGSILLSFSMGGTLQYTIEMFPMWNVGRDCTSMFDKYSSAI